MAPINANLATGEGSGVQQGISFRQNRPATTTATRHAQALRTVIFGSNQASANGVTAHGHAPVLALCRKLIEAGHDPNTPLEAYRGTTLCLKVRSIGEGARLTVKDGADGKPRFAAFHPGPNGAPGIATASHVAQTAEGVAQDREAHARRRAMTSAAALSVYADPECLGFIRPRGISGFEAPNLERRPLGLFQSRSEAANAIQQDRKILSATTGDDDV
jgi:hypothetical protein